MGVDPDADDNAVKTAYRKIARKYHPDVSAHDDTKAQFKEFVEPYEVLKDKAKRTEYDEIRHYGGAQQEFRPPPDLQSSGSASGDGHHYRGDSSDFFSSIFGGGGGAQAYGFSGCQDFGQRGQDIETELPIFLEDTLSVESKKLSYHFSHHDSAGRVTEMHKTLNVKILIGVVDGERIRLKGQGAPGLGKGASGDLYLRIRLVPHSLFDVEEHNLIITLPAAPWEAALGGKVTLPTLSSKIQLTVSSGSQSGQRLRVKGRGLSGKLGQGDLYAVLKIVMPASSSTSVKEQWQKLAELAPLRFPCRWSEAS